MISQSKELSLNCVYRNCLTGYAGAVSFQLVFTDNTSMI